MRTFSCWLALFLCLAPAAQAPAQQKLAQTGMKFLNILPDARAEALGEAFTAVEGNSSAMFYNTAAMARVRGMGNVFVATTQWIADIKHYYGALALSPYDGDYGVLGFNFQFVDYGTIEETIRWENEQGYQDLGTFTPSAMVLGVAYSRALSDKFSIGANVKWVKQALGDATVRLEGETPVKVSNTTSLFAFDFGILYRTGFKSLNFGMTVRNFAKEARYVNEGFQLPLTFRIGVAMNVLDLTDLDPSTHAFLVAVDAEHPRDFQEQLRIGGEYRFMEILALRGGFVTGGDEYGGTFGVGLQKDFGDFGLGVDYAYLPFGRFNAAHRFSLQFSL